jgi:hypothetical protein
VCVCVCVCVCVNNMVNFSVVVQEEVSLEFASEPRSIWSLPVS